MKNYYGRYPKHDWKRDYIKSSRKYGEIAQHTAQTLENNLDRDVIHGTRAVNKLIGVPQLRKYSIDMDIFTRENPKARAEQYLMFLESNVGKGVFEIVQGKHPNTWRIKDRNLKVDIADISSFPKKEDVTYVKIGNKAYADLNYFKKHIYKTLKDKSSSFRHKKDLNTLRRIREYEYKYKPITKEQFRRSPALQRRFGRWNDTDGDGVVNWNDCRVFDPTRQGSFDYTSPSILPGGALYTPPASSSSSSSSGGGYSAVPANQPATNTSNLSILSSNNSATAGISSTGKSIIETGVSDLSALQPNSSAITSTGNSIIVGAPAGSGATGGGYSAVPANTSNLVTLSNGSIYNKDTNVITYPADSTPQLGTPIIKDTELGLVGPNANVTVIDTSGNQTSNLDILSSNNNATAGISATSSSGGGYTPVYAPAPVSDLSYLDSSPAPPSIVTGTDSSGVLQLGTPIIKSSELGLVGSDANVVVADAPKSLTGQKITNSEVQYYTDTDGKRYSTTHYTITDADTGKVLSSYALGRTLVEEPAPVPAPSNTFSGSVVESMNGAEEATKYYVDNKEVGKIVNDPAGNYAVINTPANITLPTQNISLSKEGILVKPTAESQGLNNLGGLNKDDRGAINSNINTFGGSDYSDYKAGKEEKSIFGQEIRPDLSELSFYSYKYLPPLIRTIPKLAEDIITGVAKGGIKTGFYAGELLTGYKLPQDDPLLKWTEYERGNPVYLDKDVQTYALTLATIGAGMVAPKITSYGLAGFQTYQTVKSPSEENIAGLGLAVLPLIPDMIKAGKNVAVKIGKGYTPAEEVFSSDVINKVSEFPTTTSPTETISKFESTKTPEGYLKGTTTMKFKPEAEAPIKAGFKGSSNIEDAGAWVTPEGEASPFFTGLSKSKQYELTLNPFKEIMESIKNNPNIVNVKIRDISEIPAPIKSKAIELYSLDKTKGYEFINDWYRQEAIKGNAYIPLRSVVKETEELQALIPEGNYWKQLSADKYTTYEKTNIPIREYELVSKAAGEALAKAGEKIFTPKQVGEIISRNYNYYVNSGITKISPYGLSAITQVKNSYDSFKATEKEINTIKSLNDNDYREGNIKEERYIKNLEEVQTLKEANEIKYQEEYEKATGIQKEAEKYEAPKQAEYKPYELTSSIKPYAEKPYEIIPEQIYNRPYEYKPEPRTEAISYEALKPYEYKPELRTEPIPYEIPKQVYNKPYEYKPEDYIKPYAEVPYEKPYEKPYEITPQQKPYNYPEYPNYPEYNYPKTPEFPTGKTPKDIPEIPPYKSPPIVPRTLLKEGSNRINAFQVMIVTKQGKEIPKEVYEKYGDAMNRGLFIVDETPEIKFKIIPLTNVPKGIVKQGEINPNNQYKFYKQRGIYKEKEEYQYDKPLEPQSLEEARELGDKGDVLEGYESPIWPNNPNLRGLVTPYSKNRKYNGYKRKYKKESKGKFNWLKYMYDK